MRLSFIYSHLMIVFIIILNGVNHFNIKPKSKNSLEYKTSLSKINTEYISQGQLRLSLYEDTALANNESPADGLLIFFDTEGNNDVDINDALDITNLDENFSTNNNGVLLSIETRAIPVDNEEVQLEVNTYRNTNYTIVAEGSSMQCATAFLYDNYTEVLTEIPQDGIANYSYSVALGVPASVANDRFKIIFDAESSQLIWNGSVSNDWNNSANWTPNGVPNSCSNITIPSTETLPQISQDLTISSLNINSGMSLTVPNGITLNVIGDLNMYSESTTYSGLVVKGEITVFGATKYHRYTNSELNGRDLIAPPLSGQSWESFLTDDNSYNTNILYNNGVELPNTTYLFGHFEKGITDNYLVYNHNTIENLYSGRGYRVSTNTPIGEGNGEALTFTGSIAANSVSVLVENDFTGNFPEWNLIGNPYASYIDVNAFLNHVGSVSGMSNLSLLEDSSAAIYGYDANNTDGSGSNWTIANLLEGPELIAPGQGFFVSSKLSSANLEFTPEMQAEGNSDDFIVGRTTSDVNYIKLRLSSSSGNCMTSIYFHDNAGLGLDVGYDAAVFGGNISEFALYSHLVDNNEGIPFRIQAVNSSDILDVTIPLGVNVNEEQELTFSITESTLPTSTNVYLEDTFAGTLTLLTNTHYSIFPTTELSGTGRFFLRITESVLSTTPNNSETLNIFFLNNSKELIVKGHLYENTRMMLYDVQGRAVSSHELNSSVSENRINLSRLKEGVYIVYLQNQIWKKSKKVVVN